MKYTLQVVLYVSLATGSWCLQATEKASNPSTLKTPSLSSADKIPTPKSDNSEESGLSHIIKHSKLFTEFVSFAVNPVKSMDIVDSVRTNVLSNYTLPLHTNETSTNDNTTSQLNQTQSSEVLQELLIEMTKVNSPGLIVTFDYLNVTVKSSNGEDKSRTPVRLWGMVPDEVNNKTVYFFANYFMSSSYDADTKQSAKEQIEDFVAWKNETLANLSSDKLSDVTIGILVGGG